MKKLTALFLTVFLIGLCGCSAKTKPTEKSTSETETKANTIAAATTATKTTASSPVSGFTLETYPRMGGSLANLPLGEAITSTVLSISREKANSIITFENSTTYNYKSLCDKRFDILLAYEPSEEAKQYSKDTGVELEMTPIGVDALVFICNKKNSVSSLTLDQVKEIYRGNITSWSEVGGNYNNIIPYQRNTDSGSQTLFDKLVNLGDSLMDAPSEQIAGGMGVLLEYIADYDNSDYALGYTVYYYLTNMESEKLNRCKILDIDGITPNNETIGNGEYPLTNDFYVVIRKDAKPDSPERVLYDWICSDQGKELVKKENYPVRITE